LSNGRAEAGSTSETDALKREVERLTAELAARSEIAKLAQERDAAKAEAEATAQGAPKASRDLWAMVKAQKTTIDRLRKELAASRAANGLGPDAEAAIARLVKERDGLVDRLTKAEAKLDGDPGAVGKLEKDLKAAKTRIQNETRRRNVLAAALDEARKANPVSIAKRDWRKLSLVCQPDSGRNASDKARHDAAVIFNALKFKIIDDDKGLSG
jgi:chromosome segregation ATPase